VKWLLREIHKKLKLFFSYFRIFIFRYNSAKKRIHMDGVWIHGADFTKLKIEKNVWINNAFLDLHNTISIEEDVTFGHKVKILTGTHNIYKFGKERAAVISKPVVIKRGAWIASYAIVLPGTIIGEYAVVAAGSVVRGEVPPYALMAGNPAKQIASIPENMGIQK
jgi:acetyltransferase-like isoleucine patch superfamily enzyme